MVKVDEWKKYAVSLLHTRKKKSAMVWDQSLQVATARSEQEALGTALMEIEGEERYRGFELSSFIVIEIQ